MAKYINREELVEWLKRIPLKDLSDGLGLCRIIMEEGFKRAIQTIPAGTIIDVATVRHGRWIWRNKWEPFEFKYECSICHDGSDLESKYCPNCGAKMQEVE